MSEHFPLLVPGAEADAKSIEVCAPFDRTPIAKVQCAGVAGVDRALQTAYDLFRQRDRWLSPARRVDILRAPPQSCTSAASILALEAAREGGKPLD